MIAALTSNGSDSDGVGAARKGKDDITHTLSDNTLNAMRNVSESELAALHDASLKLQQIVQVDVKPPIAPANTDTTPSLARTRRAYSSSDFHNDNGLPPFANGDKRH